MKKVLTIILFLTASAGFAQETNSYWMSASEFIFSMGNVDAGDVKIDPVVRFSGFFHLQEQLHYDINNNVGIFTGFGFRNVGMINQLNDSIKVKQRAYSFGVPVAVKIGNLKRFYIDLGGEAEFFFNYKQKVFYGGEKFKTSEWFSDKVNLINPSLFLDLNFRKGSYIRFKYYLLDFLTSDNQNIKIYGNRYTYRPEKSQLFYIAIGAKLKNTRKQHVTTDTSVSLY